MKSLLDTAKFGQLFGRVGGGAVPASVLVSVSVFAAVLGFNPTTVLRLDQTSPAAWLALEHAGAVALYDGSVPDQPASALAEVAAPGDELQVVQANGGALILSPSEGTLVSVDGKTRRSGQPVQLPDADATARLEAGPSGDVWVLAGEVARRIETATLRAAEPVILPSDLDDLVVDARGQLWVSANGSVGLIEANDPVLDSEGPVSLGLAGTSPLALDSSGRLTFLSDGRTCDLELGTDAALHRTTSAALITDAEAGVALIVDHDCGVDMIEGLGVGVTIDQTVEAGGWFYLLDSERRRVWTVNVADPRTNTWTEELTEGDGPVQLVGAGNVVFFNQGSTDAAGVVLPTGELSKIQKTRESPDGNNNGGNEESDEVDGLEGDDTNSSSETGSGQEQDADVQDQDAVDEEQVADEVIVETTETQNAEYFCQGPAEVAVGDPEPRMTAISSATNSAVDASWDIDRGSGRSFHGQGTSVAIPTDQAGVVSLFFTVNQAETQCDVTVADPATLDLVASIRQVTAGAIVEGALVTFTSDSEGLPDSYRWSVSGARASIEGERDGPSVTIRFPEEGSASLSLQVGRSEDSASANVDLALNVQAEGPEEFGLELLCPGQVVVDTSFTLSALATGGSIADIDWTLPTGDSRPPHSRSSETSLSWALAGPGTFAFSATASDPDGMTETASCQVSAVYQLNPVIAGPVAAEVGETVSFNSDYQNSVDSVSVAWDFGDGSTGSGDRVSHQFSRNGEFVVSATFSAADASTQIATHRILIGGVVVPRLAGSTLESAESTVAGLGLSPVVAAECSTTADEGQVSRTEPPANSAALPGDAVTIFVASPPRLVPDIASLGVPPNSADSVVQGLSDDPGISVNWVSVSSGGTPGAIVGQTPGPGTEQCGSYVVRVEYVQSVDGGLTCHPTVTYPSPVVCDGPAGLSIDWGDGSIGMVGSGGSARHGYDRAGQFIVKLMDGTAILDSKEATVLPDVKLDCPFRSGPAGEYIDYQAECTFSTSTPGATVTVSCSKGRCGGNGTASVSIVWDSNFAQSAAVTATVTGGGVSASMSWLIRYSGCG